MFPPRLRGWTCPRRLIFQAPTVSPALAGMDPSRALSGLGKQSFPRACGDGPQTHLLYLRSLWFPPRLRGWTIDLRAFDDGWTVSPALAGMDPGSTPCWSKVCRFPRACGDGPSASAASCSATAFPPRLRGWTLRHSSSDAAPPVSPALAGMDPRRCPPGASRSGFPRACGDGPGRPGHRRRRSLFPPRLRGWTLAEVMAEHGAGVSPALAGMDRSAAAGSGALIGFPRACGDGPQPREKS